METTTATLERIKAKYPAALSALPEGWRFLNNGERIGKKDKHWAFGDGPFKENDKWNIGYLMSNGYFPVIRRVRTKKIKDALPGLVWPSEVKKEGMVKDMVYVGAGNPFGIQGLADGLSLMVHSNGWHNGLLARYSGDTDMRFYFAVKNHPMLKKTPTKSVAELKAEIASLKTENTTLKGVNKALKARILKFEKLINDAAFI